MRFLVVAAIVVFPTFARAERFTTCELHRVVPDAHYGVPTNAKLWLPPGVYKLSSNPRDAQRFEVVGEANRRVVEIIDPGPLAKNAAFALVYRDGNSSAKFGTIEAPDSVAPNAPPIHQLSLTVDEPHPGRILIATEATSDALFYEVTLTFKTRPDVRFGPLFFATASTLSIDQSCGLPALAPDEEVCIELRARDMANNRSEPTHRCDFVFVTPQPGPEQNALPYLVEPEPESTVGRDLFRAFVAYSIIMLAASIAMLVRRRRLAARLAKLTPTEQPAAPLVQFLTARAARTDNLAALCWAVFPVMAFLVVASPWIVLGPALAFTFALALLRRTRRALEIASLPGATVRVYVEANIAQPVAPGASAYVQVSAAELAAQFLPRASLTS